MATTSTVPTVKARLVTLLTTALATAGTTGGQVQVSYAWPGPATENESVFLGRHAELIVDPTTGNRLTSDIPTMKAGRKQRQEVYTLEATVWSFRPDLSPDEAATAEARGFTLFGHLEDVLADDPDLGIPTTIQRAQLISVDVALIPFEKGWASVLVPSIEVHARLT